MSKNRVLFSERCRTLAEECREKARSFHDDKQRVRMLDLAADYERKSAQAAKLEESLQEPIVEAPSLIPQIAEAFITRLRTDRRDQPNTGCKEQTKIDRKNRRQPSKKSRKPGASRRKRKTAS